MFPKAEVRIAYALGLVFIVSAMIYFFASNWAGLHRLEQVVFAGALTIVIYAAATISAFVSLGSWFSRTAAVAGTFAYGITIVLLGQIYNTHADYYGLFLLWSVPTVVFAILTKMWNFKLMAYILVHVTILTYMDTFSWMNRFSTATYELVVGSTITVLNIALITWIARTNREEPMLRVVATLVSGFALLWMSNSILYDTTGMIINVAMVGWIVWHIRYGLRNGVRGKRELLLAAILSAFFLSLKFGELASTYPNSKIFFMLGIVFVALMLTGTAKFIQYYRRIRPDEANEVADHPVATSTVAKQPTPSTTAPKVAPAINDTDLIWGVVSAVSVVIASACIIGLIALFAPDGTEAYNMVIISMLLIFMSYIFGKKMASPIVHTLQFTAVVLGQFIYIWDSMYFYTLYFILVTAYVWHRINNVVASSVLFILFNVFLLQLLDPLLGNQIVDFWYTGLIIFSFNVVIAVVTYFWKFNYAKRSILFIQSYMSALFIGLLLAGEVPDQATRYWVASIIYFVALIVIIFRSDKHRHRLYYWTSFSALLLFLVQKYYETAWKLLHKSFTLGVLGIVLITLAVILHRRSLPPHAPVQISKERLFLRTHKTILILVALFQLLSVVTIVSMNEYALAHGKEIRLKLQPVDPRGMLQGDYLYLEYDHLTTMSKSELIGSTNQKLETGDAVRLVLAPVDNKGTYAFNRIYTNGVKLADDEVILNGEVVNIDSFSGQVNLHFGIDTYFIAENTGTKLSEVINYAKVKLSSGGNAILVDVSAN